jgi:glycosyltransferase involved in cell wall biosynthesis
VLSPALDAAELPSRPPDDAEERLGILIRPGSDDELRAGIRFLVEHPEWRSRLGSNARRRVLDRFTWRHHVAAILEKVERRDGESADAAV